MYIFLIDPDRNVLPTMGFKTVSLKHNSYSVKIYDLGGSFQIRALWPKYYNDVSNMCIFSKRVTLKSYMSNTVMKLLVINCYI